MVLPCGRDGLLKYSEPGAVRWTVRFLIKSSPLRHPSTSAVYPRPEPFLTHIAPLQLGSVAYGGVSGMHGRIMRQATDEPVLHHGMDSVCMYTDRGLRVQAE